MLHPFKSFLQKPMFHSFILNRGNHSCNRKSENKLKSLNSCLISPRKRPKWLDIFGEVCYTVGNNKILALRVEGESHRQIIKIHTIAHITITQSALPKRRVDCLKEEEQKILPPYPSAHHAAHDELKGNDSTQNLRKEEAVNTYFVVNGLVFTKREDAVAYKQSCK